jgi:hypothetical protein
MRKITFWSSMFAVGSVALLLSAPAAVAGDKSGKMSFFITSVGMGNGANLGGLAGADKHCQSLAAAAGAGKRTWRAYLSTQGKNFKDPVVHARERSGKGPWYNAKGQMVAKSVKDLHTHNQFSKALALDENGQPVNSRTDKPNKHDILTGSRPDGTAFAPSPPFTDRTCSNWTNGGNDGAAMVGHHDRMGPTGDAWGSSWNSAHPTLGCSADLIPKTGGDALFYCFAVK